jgi:hypothetical protein
MREPCSANSQARQAELATSGIAKFWKNAMNLQHRLDRKKR